MSLQIRLLVCLFCFSLSGCISTSSSERSHYYRLQSPDLTNKIIQPGVSELVVVGPVTLADYLSRSSVTLVHSETEYEISDLDLWAGKLEDEIQLALLKHLADLDPVRVMVSYPWLADNTPNYSLRINILRFDASPGGLAKLQASWYLFDKRNQLLSGSHFSAATDAGVDYSQSVAAMSQLLADMAAQIHQNLPPHQ